MYIQSHIGEIAALSVSVLWTISALFFEKAGHKAGSLSVNVIRLSMAVVMLGFTTLFINGSFLPTDATSYQWFWLGLSGIVGFFLGDLFLFKSYTLIGARTTSLIMSLAPMLTAVISWFFLDEILSLKSILGIVISVTGIAIAISNRNMKLNIPLKGFLFALGATLGQAGGLILSKKGIGDYNAVSATQIRAIIGLLCFVIFVTFIKRWENVQATVKDKNCMANITVGAIFGPFIGVAFALFALQHTETGIASTLMALVPIFIILPSAIMFKEKIKPQQIIGAVISVIGASIFFL